MAFRLLYILIVIFFIPAFTYGQADVKIGNQVWTSKNLDVKTFRNGDPINYAKNRSEWENFGKKGQPAFCYLKFDPNNAEKYGAYYNFYAVEDQRGLAPAGYHIPSIDEWNGMVRFIVDKDNKSKNEYAKYLRSPSGWDLPNKRCENCENWTSEQLTGKKDCPICKPWSKEYRSKKACDMCFDTREVAGKMSNCQTCKNVHWVEDKSFIGINEYGLNLKAGGYCSPLGDFFFTSSRGQWWSVSRGYYDPYGTPSKYFKMEYNFTYAQNDEIPQETGMPIRCVKDEIITRQPTKGDIFLAETKKKPGIITTNSGLQYKIINQTTGPKPSTNSTVKVNYTGKLLDGKIFDSSKEEGPREFKLTNVIKGWVEGIQLMSKGSKYVFIIPSYLAFGENGAGDVIGPNEVLLFEVELVDFKD